MKQLIEVKQEYLIVCDNTACDYKILNETGNPFIDVKEYINKPCPKCGDNLLTEDDYIRSRNLERIILFINKWFSWLTIFVPKSKKTETITKISTHKGINIIK